MFFGMQQFLFGADRNPDLEGTENAPPGLYRRGLLREERLSLRGLSDGGSAGSPLLCRIAALPEPKGLGYLTYDNGVNVPAPDTRRQFHGQQARQQPRVPRDGNECYRARRRGDRMRVLH